MGAAEGHRVECRIRRCSAVLARAPPPPQSTNPRSAAALASAKGRARGPGAVSRNQTKGCPAGARGAAPPLDTPSARGIRHKDRDPGSAGGADAPAAAQLAQGSVRPFAAPTRRAGARGREMPVESSGHTQRKSRDAVGRLPIARTSARRGPRCVPVELGIGDDVLGELHAVARLPREDEELVRIHGHDFLLVVLDGYNLVHRARVAAHHHKVPAPQTHEEVHRPCLPRGPGAALRGRGSRRRALGLPPPVSAAQGPLTGRGRDESIDSALDAIGRPAGQTESSPRLRAAQLGVRNMR